MENKDIRWIQRFSNYRKALARLVEAVNLHHDRELNDLEKQGMIKAFEFTFELAWNTLQDFIRDRIDPAISGGPNVIISRALAEEIISDEENWKAMHQFRKNSAHTYNAETADEIIEEIVSVYQELFIGLETRLQLEMLKQTGK